MYINTMGCNSVVDFSLCLRKARSSILRNSKSKFSTLDTAGQVCRKNSDDFADVYSMVSQCQKGC
ncbi:hypothetical protein OUZ56_009714 [Daphnia magna]|uniref:Uncharacterized protein n=1 Tax=Daphnia magna TaxID=35525 RepID=A0ABR0AGS0_9CRUS|nr:hypothetical protein OUZ56_009714 [Daphnia magna]